MKLNRTDGEHSRTRKVDWSTVAKIRKHYAKSDKRNLKLAAAKFGLSASAYLKIANGQQWKVKEVTP